MIRYIYFTFLVSLMFIFSSAQQGIPAPEKTDMHVQIQSPYQYKYEAEMSLIAVDLNDYKTLSTTTRSTILTSIREASERFRVSPLLLHAIFRIESDYRFNIDHPEVTIKIHGKLQKTHARGMGGTVWDIWADSLQANGLCETSSDLYMPKNSIFSTAFIVRKILDNQKVSEKNVVATIVAYYYGKADAQYNSHIRDVMADLMMKSMSGDLFASASNPETKIVSATAINFHSTL